MNSRSCPASSPSRAIIRSTLPAARANRLAFDQYQFQQPASKGLNFRLSSSSWHVRHRLVSSPTSWRCASGLKKNFLNRRLHSR